jgi:hypothetical protein
MGKRFGARAGHLWRNGPFMAHLRRGDGGGSTGRRLMLALVLFACVVRPTSTEGLVMSE